MKLGLNFDFLLIDRKNQNQESENLQKNNTQIGRETKIQMADINFYCLFKPQGLRELKPKEIFCDRYSYV